MVECPILYKHIPMMTSEHLLHGKLMQFDLLEFDIILEMDCLTTHVVNICCKTLKVTLNDQKGQEACFYGGGI